MEHFAWPIATLVFGIFFVVLFRQQIGNFLTRVNSVSREGLSTVPSSNKRNVEQQADAPDSKDVQSLLQSFDSPALLHHERLLFSDLEARKLDSSSDTTKVLVRYLAKTRLFLACEFVYRLIFGSQIALLKRINELGGKMTAAETRAFYDAVSRLHPDVFPANHSEPYLDFLLRQGLVSSKEDHFHLTDFGREFLTWLVHSGASENKNL